MIVLLFFSLYLQQKGDYNRLNGFENVDPILRFCS